GNEQAPEPGASRRAEAPVTLSAPASSPHKRRSFAEECRRLVGFIFLSLSRKTSRCFSCYFACGVWPPKMLQSFFPRFPIMGQNRELNSRFARYGNLPATH